jgi:hypothetical protein
MTNNSLFFKDLDFLHRELYSPCSFICSEAFEEAESIEYGAGRLKLSGTTIKQRTAKITPTKIGQFVTLWKRNSRGETQPHEETDEFDFFVINVKSGEQFGQFIFPKSALVEQGIVISSKHKGKRGIRVYPPWDKPISKQAMKTQSWQLKYFLEVNKTNLDLYLAKKLYESN